MVAAVSTLGWRQEYSWGIVERCGEKHLELYCSSFLHELGNSKFTTEYYALTPAFEILTPSPFAPEQQRVDFSHAVVGNRCKSYRTVAGQIYLTRPDILK